MILKLVILVAIYLWNDKKEKAVFNFQKIDI